jgi:hypothetical protein
MYRDGMRPGEIADALGAHRGTIHRALIESGACEPSENKGGPARKQSCKHGHDLSIHGIELKGGGRDCRECKRRRDREAKKAKYWAAKNQQTTELENQNSDQEAA